MDKYYFWFGIWELLFLYYIIYFFSFEISFFPWFHYMPDRWGAGMILIFILLMFFVFCIPLLFQITSATKKRKFRVLSILIFISLCMFFLYNSFYSIAGFFTILLITIYKSVDVFKSIKAS